MQFKPSPKLSLRAGFNFWENPVKEHNNFDASTLKTIQGKTTTNFRYEYLRIVGFPAIAESHLGLGIGYDFSDTLSANIGYNHAFETTISETGTNFFGPGADVTLESELSEDSFEFGLTKRF